MKKYIPKIIFGVLLVSAFLSVWFENQTQAQKENVVTDRVGTIHVKLTGISKKEGDLMVGLFRNKKEFLVSPFKGRILPVTGTQEEVVFEKVPYGDYAVSVIQDLNKNRKLDFFMVFPSEPWGLSNNVKPMGPPQFEPCKFILDSPHKTLSIDIH